MMLEAGSNPRIKNKGGLTAYQLVDPTNTELRDLIQRQQYAVQNAGDFVSVTDSGNTAAPGRNAPPPPPGVPAPGIGESEFDEDAEFSGSDDEERAEWDRRRREWQARR